MEEIMPSESVTENPLIGPEPKTNKRTAAINVVTFASNIVEIALLNPSFIASNGLEFFDNSSFILSKIKTLASTAMPIVKTIPAIPGRVNVAPIVPNKDIIIKILIINEKLAMNPKVP